MNISLVKILHTSDVGNGDAVRLRRVAGTSDSSCAASYNHQRKNGLVSEGLTMTWSMSYPRERAKVWEEQWRWPLTEILEEA
jgi:hypothetical protein